jgi:HSP20 family protein
VGTYERISRVDAQERPPAVTSGTAWSPSLDLQEENDRFVLRADVPGVSAKDIEVSTEDGTLTVRGERPARERAGNDGFEQIECAAGSLVALFHPAGFGTV